MKTKTIELNRRKDNALYDKFKYMDRGSLASMMIYVLTRKQKNQLIEELGIKFSITIFILLLSSCASNPYWSIKHHDGIEQRTYMKRAWPIDQTCRTYTGNNPIQRKTWSNQFYWKKK